MTEPTPRPFSQVDVFTAVPYLGNPVAVVHDADDLTDDAMAAFARWTNLSETTFLLRPTTSDADYRLRIFTPGGELPFAGHPTIGSAHAWLAAGGTPARAGQVVQECGVGLVTLRTTSDGQPPRGVAGADRAGATSSGLAFAAPALLTETAEDDATVAGYARALGLPDTAVVDSRFLDNGPRWHVLLLDSAQRVLDVRPDWSALGDVHLGIVGPYPPGGDVAFEVRGFAPAIGVPEDPVTGSLNAVVGQWLTSTGRAPATYVASQGTVLGRRGRVRVERDADGTVWVGGDAVTCVAGTVVI